MLTSIDRYFSYDFLEWQRHTWQLASLHSVLEHDNILITDISQGSVATHLRCVEIFNDDFIANLRMSLSVKEL